MIPDIKELNFPEYATLSQASVTLNDMGERIISTQVKIDGDIKPDFSYNWEIEFKGEKYIHPLRSPQAIKDNTSICSKIDLVFQHWVIYELKRHYFVELVSIKSGTAIPNKYITPLGLSVEDFVVAFQNVLDYYYKGEIKIQLNPDIEYSKDRAFINISYSYIWDVLQEFYKVYGLRWCIAGDTIYVGYPATEISHIFEYGYEKGLISLERQVQDTNIRNILLGRGGSTNLPQYYFKNAPKDSLYASDPDAIPELANVYFSELRGKTFRDYVQGWKTNPNRDTQDGTIAIEPYDTKRGEIDFAYKRGHEDKDFDPIEYVKDDVSIAKFGELPGGLDNNEEIYPSIQNISLTGIGLVNEIVAVEPVVSDDIDQATGDDAIISNISDITTTKTSPRLSNITISVSGTFSVKEGYAGSLTFTPNIKVIDVWGEVDGEFKEKYLEFSQIETEIWHNESGNLLESGINLPSGSYTFTVFCSVKNKFPDTTTALVYGTAYITLSVNNIKLTQSRFTETGEEWKPTFDVWVKNIWQTEKRETETNEEYADRVWLPILGDEGREAMVTFSSGWLSSSEGWEFMVVKGGYAYDTSKSYNGVPSHWKLTLQKTDAEIKATGKYVPNMGMQAIAGDTFLFTGIDMQHQYVLFAEQRLDEWKSNSLQDTKDILPTWISKLDKVRVNTLESADVALLVDSIKIGALIHIADKRFIEGTVDRYIQTLTYNYLDKLYPDIEIVLSDKPLPVDNPVQRIQGQVDLLSAQIARPTSVWVNQLRQIFDAIYLRKDGVEDLSKSPTSFNSLVKSGDFRGGMIGGAGWGIYRDMNGNTIAEFDQVKARQTFLANDFVRNEAEHIGGMQVYSAASIKISKVVETETGYECYFDRQGGSKANLFAIDDVAYCQAFSPENATINFYKRRVIAKGEDYITLSKTYANGEGIPAVDDVVIHFGNYSDKTRQYVIIRDIIGGGYDRMLSNLDSVTAVGIEYYFAGISQDGVPRWFVGNKQSGYAEWDGKTMRIKGTLEVGSDVGGATVVDGGLVTAETISLGGDGAIKAGSTGVGSSDSDVRFWAGTTFENRHNAPFRVLQNGDTFANRGVFSGFVQSGTTYITNDNYKEYFLSENYSDPTKFWNFDADKCSPCIIIKINNLSLRATISLPSLQLNDALSGTPIEELERLRGFIGQSIIIYHQGSGNGFNFRYCDETGQYSEFTGEDVSKPALGVGEFVKFDCYLGSKYSATYGKNVEYIYWRQSVKGSLIARTDAEAAALNLE